MKVRLLKKLRNIGREMIEIRSITTTNGVTTGMSIGMDSSEYRGLFSYGNTEEEVKEKAAKIYLENNIEKIRKKYSKYRRLNKFTSTNQPLTFNC
jgi:hypothetical protein